MWLSSSSFSRSATSSRTRNSVESETPPLGPKISTWEVQVLSDRRRMLGDDHPETLITASALAETYQMAGDLARAIPLFEQTLRGCQRVLGDDHPTTRTLQADLAAARQE
jgi:hypothetical protein